MKYKHVIETADKILEASGCEYDEEYGWLFILGNKLGYHGLDEKTAEQVVDETLGSKSIDWYNKEMTDGTIEIDGERIRVYFAQSQAYGDE